ncbi:ABC transporter substrate-binding protein [Xanthobacter sp. KR7-65]|uniref:ABC transporter substrate-binding protein n=1 Tax=Xanthobacter sp. KR7-65 TaxID=3156612 RepID=UPI0032B456D7
MLKLTRRGFMGSMLAAPAVLAAPAIIGSAHSQEKRKITFTLPFLAEGNNAYVFVAKAKGYWDELGLDVTVSRGYGSVAAAQAIAAGQFQFGMAVPTAAIQQAAKGLGLVAIASAGYDATMGICLLNSSPIHAPKDLAGKKMASVVTSGEHPFLPAFAKITGFDLKSVEIVQTDANVRQRLLTTGQVDCMSGFAVSFIPPLISQNYEAHAMLYSNHGLTLYNNALLTQPATLEKEPKLCADVAAGLLKGLKYTLLEPEESIKLFAKEVPETTLSPGGLERTRIGIGICSNSALFDVAQKNGLGYASESDYGEMIDLVMKYVAGPSDKAPKVKDVMSNDYIGKLMLTPEEWTQAKAKAQPFVKYLAEKAG